MSRDNRVFSCISTFNTKVYVSNASIDYVMYDNKVNYTVEEMYLNSATILKKGRSCD